jgi:hypothetical protein
MEATDFFSVLQTQRRFDIDDAEMEKAYKTLMVSRQQRADISLWLSAFSVAVQVPSR